MPQPTITPKGQITERLLFLLSASIYGSVTTLHCIQLIFLFSATLLVIQDCWKNIQSQKNMETTNDLIEIYLIWPKTRAKASKILTAIHLGEKPTTRLDPLRQRHVCIYPTDARTVWSKFVCAFQHSSRFEPAVDRAHSIVCSQDTLVENVEEAEGLPRRFLPKKRADRGWYSSLTSFVLVDLKVHLLKELRSRVSLSESR